MDDESSVITVIFITDPAGPKEYFNQVAKKTKQKKTSSTEAHYKGITANPEDNTY